MKKFFLLIPFVLLLSCNSGADISPSDTFIKFYGGGATYELMDMTLRADGEDGVVLLALRTGSVFDGGELVELASNQSLYVIITDGSGNAVLETRIPVLDEFGDEREAYAPARITALADGGYYIVSSTQAEPAPFDGSLPVMSVAVWQEFSSSFENSTWNAVGDTLSNFVGVDISAAEDGGIVVAGYTDTHGSNDFFFEKSGGAEQWSRIERRDNSDDRLVRVLPTSSGQFALFGRTDVASDDGEDGANVERTVIDQDGLITNSLIYGITWTDAAGEPLSNVLHDVPYDVVEKPGGFAVVGASFENAQLTGESIPFFMNVDLTGANSDEQDYRIELQTGNSQSFGRAIGVTQTTTNDFVIVGDVDGLDDNGKEILILKTDQEGNMINEPLRYGLLNGDERARRALTATDGSIYVGTTYDFGGGLSQIGLLKLNPDGELRQ